MRGIAVALVIWLHARQQLQPDLHDELPDLGVYGIDIFFVISGFILGTVVARSPQKPGLQTAWHFLKRRLVRIYPIFWLSCIPISLVMMHRHQPLTLQYVPGFLLLPSWTYPNWEMIGDVSWTLIFEMFFYSTLSVILLLSVRRALPLTIALMSALGLFGTLSTIHVSFLIVYCNPILLEFVFGLCIALVFQRYGRRRRLGIAMLSFGVMATFAAKLFASNVQYVANGMQMVQVDAHVSARVMTWGLAATTLIAGMVFWSPAPTGSVWKFMVAIGNSSYSTYLVSTLVLGKSIQVVLSIFHQHIPFSTGLHLACQIAVCATVMATGWICYRFIELPLLRYLQRVLHLGR